MENTVRPYISYWFDQRNNLALDYSFTDGTYSGGPGGLHSPDFTTQNPHGRYTYRFDAQMAVFADYAYLNQINDSPGINYYVNSPSLGIVYNLNPTLTATVQAGWFWMDPERDKAQDGLVSNVSITQRDGQTTYTLAFNSGYQQNLFSFDTQGFYKYYGGSAVISHSVTQRFNFRLHRDRPVYGIRLRPPQRLDLHGGRHGQLPDPEMAHGRRPGGISAGRLQPPREQLRRMACVPDADCHV